MKALELKIPPPLVTAIFAAFMWAIAQISPAIEVPSTLRITAVSILIFAGFCFDLGGILNFRKAATTVNPMKPNSASALVTTGIYRITRNPMYVGFALFLLAWGCYLSTLWAFIALPLFIAYITRFQIIPEEQALMDLFEDEFEDYTTRVRRWL